MRHHGLLATAILLAITGSAVAHGGRCFFRGPPGDAPPPPAPTTAPAPQAPPGDLHHRCAGLRGLAGEVPPDSREPTDPPPPPPPAEDSPLPPSGSLAPDASHVVARVVASDGSAASGTWIWRSDKPLVMTDDEGRIRFSAPPDARPIVLTLTGHVPRVLRLPPAPMSEPEGAPDPEAEPVTVRLEKGDSLALRLIGSDVGTAALRLVPDAETVPEDWAIASVPARWSSVRPEADGSVSFSGLPEGRYRLLATLPRLGEVTIARGLAPEPDVLDVYLPARPAQRDWRVRVRLLDRDGVPVAAPTVDVRTADGNAARATGEDGLAVVTVTGLGPLDVRASAVVGGCTGPSPPAACAHGVRDDADEITLRTPQPAPVSELRLSPPPDAPDGVFVAVFDRTRGTTSGVLWLTQKELRVPVFEDAVLDVTWGAPSWNAGTVGSTLNGFAAGATIALPPAPPTPGTVGGRVVRADGSAVVGAVVRMRAASDVRNTRIRLETKTDAEGRFRIAGAVGSVAIDAKSPGLSSEGAPAYARSGDDAVTVVVREERL